MDKFEEIELKKRERKSVKSIWFDWLINHIPYPIKKIASNPKDKILSLYYSKTSKIICGSRK